MSNTGNAIYEFGPYRIDPRKELLLHSGQMVPLTSKAFQTLLTLVENNEEVMSKERMMQLLWTDTFVEESNLAKHISMVRKALGQTAQGPGYIVTVPGVGYRFAEDVRTISADKIATITAEDGPFAEPPVLQATRSNTFRFITVLLAVLAVGTIIFNSSHRRSQLNAGSADSNTVLLVDFRNKTGDPVFDETLKQALSISLGQSPVLKVLSDEKVGATLRMMAHPDGKPLNPQLTRELCQRAGGMAYIAGSIVSLGTQYVVGLKAVDCTNGKILAQEQTTATAREKLLESLGLATTKLRAELGESLATVQKFDVPLQEATTSSLEALRAYSLGRKEAGAQGARVALPYDQRAIQLDPNFAMGYFAVGHDYFTLDEVNKARDYLGQAFQLRGQASEREKSAIAGAYYQAVTGELDHAEQTYKEQMTSYPGDAQVYLDLALVYAQQASYDAAIDASRHAVQLAPDDAAAYGVLSYNLIAEQRFDEARQTLQQASNRKLDDFVARQVLYALAFLNGDSAAMQEQAAWFTGKAAVENSGLSLESDTEAFYGHLRRARELSARAVDSALRNDSKETAAKWLTTSAVREAAFGEVHESRRVASQALTLVPDRKTEEGQVALAFAMAGDTLRAASLAQDLKRRFPLSTQVQALWLPTIQSQLALDRHDPAGALDQLYGTGSADLANIQFLANISCLYPSYVRGQAYLAAGDGVAAESQFQKILDHNGIVWNCWTGALAHLGVARANALQARTSKGADADAARKRARVAYQDFLKLWKDADPDIPVLKQAKAEYLKLR